MTQRQGATPRIGHGYDLHRLAAVDAPVGTERGRPMVLGGVAIPSERGPVAHSDGDALLHAITDAILGALGEPDIGQLFPDTDPAWLGAESAQFLRRAVNIARAAGFEVGNVDATVIAERPKVGPHKAAIRASVASMLGVGISSVNVKGKTHEGVDAVGQGLAIEVHAVVLLVPIRA